MAGPTLGTYLRGLRQAMAAGALAGCPDRELVDRLRDGPDEAAFRALLDRHGLMVLRVCRRVLSDPADAEDAFQATFLVLARRASAIRRQASVASWLHGVAHRTALKLRTDADRRRKREARAARSDRCPPSDDTPWGEVRAALDAELARLPAANRAVLVLCYLEGRTQEEAAGELGLSKRTVQRLLERGREQLGRRLARRGVIPAAALAARLVSDCSAGAALPRSLVGRTVASAGTPAGRAAPAGVLSPRVAALADGVTKAMTYVKYKLAVAAVACGLALGIGAREFGASPAAAEERPTAARSSAPDIEPIDPQLVFDPEVQKQLRLSANQVAQLTEARDKGGARAADQSKKVAEIDRRLRELQAEMERLNAERATAAGEVEKAQADGVKAVLPHVLSREAVGKLRELTLQRMQLADVLLNERVRTRLGLNDEQVKKIQDLLEKTTGQKWAFTRQALITDVTWRGSVTRASGTGGDLMTVYLGLSEPDRAELLKVLTPNQVEALERLSGLKFERK